MATRVRKLARELRRTPAEVLGLLHELGYVRYRTTEDQISDVAVARVREAVKQGVRAAPVQPATVGGRDGKGRARQEAPKTDWMGKLVPGLVRRKLEEHEIVEPARRPEPRAAQRSAPEPPAAPMSAPASSRDIQEVPRASAASQVAERARLEAERAQLEAARTELEDARNQVERARIELEEARQQVEEMRMDLEQERIELQAVRERADRQGTPLVELLEERGLRGTDEQQRALAALAGGRHLGVLLGDLHVTEVGRARRVLADRLVLVGGGIPEALQGVAAITVAPERGELPDARELERLIAEIGEQLMLQGLRRLVVVNAAPRWRRLLREGLDARIELTYHPAPGPDPDQLGRADALVLWRSPSGRPVGEEPRWAQVAGLVVDVGEVSLHGLLLRLRDRLRAG